MVLDVHDPRRAGLVLEARRPVHDIGVVQIRVSPGGVAAAEARAGIRDRTVGIHDVSYRPRSILQLEQVPWVARRLQNVEGAGILVEAAGTGAVHGHDAERRAEHPLRLEVPRQAKTRLEVVQIPLADRSLRMRNRSHPPGHRIDRGRIELRLLVILSLIGGKVGPAHAKV